MDKAQQDRAKMAVSMTADQFHELTHFKLDQLWPERSGRARKEVTMTIDQLEAIVAALQMRHRRGIEATREGETTPELDQEDRGDIEATREGEYVPKLDQEDRQNEAKAKTGDKKEDIGENGVKDCGKQQN